MNHTSFRPAPVLSMWLVSSVLLLGFNVSAKGLDEVQPRTDAEKAEDAAAAKEVAPATPAANDAKATDAVAPPVQAVPTDAAKPAAPVQPSAISLALANKLSLSAGFGFVRIPKAKLGDFAAQGVADLMVKYRVHEFASGDITAHLRYQPIHAENRVDGQSYVAILDGYHLGSTYARRFGSSWSALGSLELGYYLVYMKTRDRYPEKDKLEKNEVAFNVGTGADWQVNEKLKVGPRLYAGFGAYQTIQFSAATTMVF